MPFIKVGRECIDALGIIDTSSGIGDTTNSLINQPIKGITIMSTSTQQLTVSKVDKNHYVVENNGEFIYINEWQDHLAQTGAYGNAVIKISGCRSILNTVNKNTSNQYLLSKVVITDMNEDEYRERLMCDIIRHIATNH